VKIVNIVATVKFSTSINLEDIKNSINNTEFPFTGQRWLKMRLAPEGYYIAFYKSGKFLITGVKSANEIEEIADRVISILNNSNIITPLKQIKIHNFVITDSIEMNNSLEKLLYALDNSKTSYEPEQFPGLIYKNWGASFLLFSSGKIVMTGVKHESDIETNLTKFKNVIESLR